MGHKIHLPLAEQHGGCRVHRGSNLLLHKAANNQLSLWKKSYSGKGNRLEPLQKKELETVACGDGVCAAGNRFLRPLDLCPQAPKGRPSLISSKCSCSVVSDSFATPWTPGSSVHGISQARTLDWVAISLSRGFSRLRDRTWVSHVAGRFFTI